MKAMQGDDIHHWFVFQMFNGDKFISIPHACIAKNAIIIEAH